MNEAAIINVALHKPAFQSSLSSWSRADDSQGAVNGKKTGGFGFHTDLEESPWWMVDLGLSVPISRVDVYNREDCCSERSRSLSIELSHDGVQFTRVYGGFNHFGGALTNRPLSIRLNNEFGARFVKLQLNEPGVLHLDEVEVYAERDWFVTVELLKQFCSLHETDFNIANGGSAGSACYDLDVLRIVGNLECDKVTILRLMPYGRFGNNLAQLFNAIFLAQRLGIETLAIDGKMLRRELPFTLERLNFVALGNQNFEELCLEGNFYYCGAFAKQIKVMTRETGKMIVQRFLQPMFSYLTDNVKPAGDDHLFIHFRTGDVFSGKLVHKDFVQPPASFYQLVRKHAVRNFNISRATLVYEDYGNPCIEETLKNFQALGIQVTTQSGTFEDDMRTLLSAKQIVFGYGSFSDAICMLSPFLKNAYYFRQPGILGADRGRNLDYSQFGGGSVVTHIVDDAVDAYIARGTWQNTQAQKTMMVDYPESNLQFRDAVDST